MSGQRILKTGFTRFGVVGIVEKHSRTSSEEARDLWAPLVLQPAQLFTVGPLKTIGKKLKGKVAVGMNVGLACAGQDSIPRSSFCGLPVRDCGRLQFEVMKA